MLKLNKILIKKGFMSILTSKIFSFLMMFLIIVSGATYTMLESASNSFTKSYESVMNAGKLHDAVIKENFKFTKDEIDKSNLDIVPFFYRKNDKLQEIYKLTLTNIQNKALSQTLENNKQYYQINLKVNSNTTKGIYTELKGDILKPIKIYPNNLSNQDIIKEIQNKIESLKSQITLKLEKNLSKKYITMLKKDYGNELFAKETKSIFVSKDNKAFKVVQYNKSNDINKIIIYDGTSMFFESLTQKQIETELKNQLLKKGKQLEDINTNYYLNTNKGYKYFLNNKNGLSGVELGDPSSFEAIVSPAYANKNNKRTISPKELKKLFYNDSSFMNDLKNEPNNIKYQKYKNQLIFVDNTPFFIIGIGTTPDFAYPIIDSSLPLVDANKQAIVFTTQKGFERIEDAFRSNQQENYISIKFKNNVDKQRQNQILQEIENKTRNGIYPKSYFPNNINLVTRADDVNEQLLLVQNRTIILDKLRNTISTLSYTTTTLLIIFLLSIITMIFKMLISSNRKIFATMHALGYSKGQIAISNGMVAIVLSIIPTIISYVIGYGLQFIFIENFAILWTIPTYSSSFSFISIVAIVLIPLLAIFSIITLTTMYEMRFQIPDMLNNVVEHSTSKATKIISKIKVLGIKSKYVFSLSLKNIDKLLLITVASFISMLSLMVGFSTMFKAQNAYDATIAVSNYEFSVDLVTPTKEGGQYNELKRTNIPSLSYESAKDKANWHKPQIQDVDLTNVNAIKPNNLQNASIYLKNKLQLKAILNKNSNLPINPWDIAKRLMPENQLKIAEQNDAKIQNEIKNGKTINKVIDEQTKNNNIPYIISYNQIIIDPNDEKYTYIDAIYKNKKTNFRIKGLNLNTNMVNILGELKKVNQSKFKLPILINKYISEKFNLNQGDSLEFAIQNHVNRNIQFKSSIIKAHVISIIDGYNETGIYTSRKKANSVLGLDHKQGFNGIFTLNKKPSILRTLPLYSASGIYPATDSFIGQWEIFLKTYLASPEWQAKNTQIQDVAQFYQSYSRTPFISIINKVRWNTIDKNTFKNISKLTSAIISLVEITSILLSIIFTIIVATLIFKTNKKKIATLWTLGYRKREIFKMFLLIYIVPLCIAFALAIPMMFGILSSLRLFIINFGNILIPFATTWWIPFIALGLVAIIFVISTFITIFAQRQNAALEAFKGD